MAAANYTLYIPRSNFLPGTAAAAASMLKPGSTGQNIVPTAAQEHGTRGPFVIDTSLWSTLKFQANSPNRLVGRQVQIQGDAAWALTSYSADGAYANGWPVPAGTPQTIELTQEDYTLYVAAASGSVNLRVWVVR